MIEAVNSVLVGAQLLRGTSEQTSQPRVDVQAPAQDRIPGPVAPFVSPYIFVDVNFNKAVLQIRDSDTGDVLRQFPSESTLEARRRVELQRTPQVPEFSDVVDDGGARESAAASAPSTVSLPSGRSFGIDTTAFSGVDASFSSGVAQAQIAASALASGARAGQANSTVSVSA